MHVHPARDLIWTDILYFTANGSLKLTQKINLQIKIIKSPRTSVIKISIEDGSFELNWKDC